MSVEPVRDADLADLLPMMRAYCDFYEVAPGDVDLEALARSLIADPQGEGIQLIARAGRRPVVDRGVSAPCRSARGRRSGLGNSA